jgi:hypothetical protein
VRHAGIKTSNISTFALARVEMKSEDANVNFFIHCYLRSDSSDYYTTFLAQLHTPNSRASWKHVPKASEPNSSRNSCISARILVVKQSLPCPRKISSQGKGEVPQTCILYALFSRHVLIPPPCRNLVAPPRVVIIVDARGKEYTYPVKSYSISVLYRRPKTCAIQTPLCKHASAHGEYDTRDTGHECASRYASPKTCAHSTPCRRIAV